MKKIRDYKKMSYTIDLKNISAFLNDIESIPYYEYICTLLFAVFIISIISKSSNRLKSTIIIITIIAMNMFFIAIQRNLLRVVIPLYIVRNSYDFI